MVQIFDFDIEERKENAKRERERERERKKKTNEKNEKNDCFFFFSLRTSGGCGGGVNRVDPLSHGAR